MLFRIPKKSYYLFTESVLYYYLIVCFSRITLIKTVSREKHFTLSFLSYCYLFLVQKLIDIAIVLLSLCYRSFTGGKPTVQVHPMPSSLPTNSMVATVLTSSTSSNTNNDITSEKIREKPVVPKKPAKLILSSTSASVEAASITPLRLSTSSLNLFSPSAQSSPSTSNRFAHHFRDLFEVCKNYTVK